MKLSRPIVAALAAVLGLLQAWDSGAFSAGSTILVLVLVAIAIPVATLILFRNGGLALVAVLIAAVLTVVARILSPVPLPELTLAVVFPGMLVVFTSMAEAKRELSIEASKTQESR